MDGTENYYDANMTGPLVLVIGSEGRGVSRLTKMLAISSSKSQCVAK